MKTLHRLLRMAFAGLLLLAAGCAEPWPDRQLTLQQLVGQYNANARQVPKLWARAKIRVSFTAEDGRGFSWGSVSPLAGSSGYVMLAKNPPRAAPGADETSFVLIGREVAKDLFRAGVDAQNGLYYFWVDAGERSQAWYGEQRYAGAPNVLGLPIDPMQLMEILGVTPLPDVSAGAEWPMRPATQPATQPATGPRAGHTVMKLQTHPLPFAYMLHVLRPQPLTGQLKLWREIHFTWSDSKPPRPYKIILYDAEGLARVIAEVSDYQRIENGEGNDKLEVVMPTRFRLTWPAIPSVRTASSQAAGSVQRPAGLELVLSEMSTSHVFSMKAFDFWSHLPAGLANLVKVDAEYGPLPESPSK